MPQQPALYSKLSVAENLRLFARLEKVADPEATVARMLAQTDLEDRADEEVGRLSGGNQQRVNIAIGLLCEPPALLLDEPSASLDPRQRERLWEFIGGLAGRGTTVVFSTHNVAEVERYADRVLVLVDGELLFTGTPAELEQTVGGDTARLRGRVRALPARARPLAVGRAMRWLLVKDLQILKRSPLLVGLLVVYPIALALMIGFALSSPPGKPKVAFYSEVPPGKGKINFGNQQINISSYANELFQSIQPIKVHSRDEAIAKVKSGEALAAVIVPADIPSADPEPRHQRRRQPDGRVDPQLEGSARAPVRRPGDQLAPERRRAGRLQAGPPRRRPATSSRS